MSEETRITNEKTGGQKGSKIERYDLIPVEPLRQLATLYGHGANKYTKTDDDGNVISGNRNWEKGYDWSLSYAALQRHVNAFWGGEEVIPQTPEGEPDDPTAGMPHLSAVAWHAFALLEWSSTHPDLDDRPTTLRAAAANLAANDETAKVHTPNLDQAQKVVARSLGLISPVTGHESVESYPGSVAPTFEGIKLTEYPDPEAAPGYVTPTIYDAEDYLP